MLLILSDVLDSIQRYIKEVFYDYWSRTNMTKNLDKINKERLSKMEKILTISIAAYNAEKDISNCLNSLISSKEFSKLDIIVVNDGSTDRTAKIANEYAKKYEQSIRLINKENGGHGSTINTSIKYAKGKYYKILDSDDWVNSENLDKLIKFLEKNNVDMVLNPYDEISYESRRKTRGLNPCEGKISYDKIHGLNEMDKIVLYMHSLTFLTEVIQKMGSIIDEKCFYVDMEYCIFPLLYVKKFVCLNYPVYQYLLGSQTQSMNIDNMIKRRNQHLKVTKRLIYFYGEHYSELDEKVREIIALRIKYAIYNQYLIYLHMSVKDSKTEIVKFDKWLKEQNRELYSGPKGKIMCFIKINRRFNYKLFAPFTNLIKKIGMIK